MNLREQHRISHRIILYVILMLGLAALAGPLRAGSATWDTNPTTNDWNTASNWTPETIPSEPGDVATFGVSNVTNISISSYVFVSEVVFAKGAGSYTIVGSGGFSGKGVINNSGVTQHFEGVAGMGFLNTASAGNNVVYTVDGTTSLDQFGTIFDDGSTAGSATLINNGAPAGGGYAAYSSFRDHTTAGTSTIINNAGPTGNNDGGETDFTEYSSAGQSKITTYAGASLVFDNNSSAGSAGLTVDGGTVYFEVEADGGTARLTLSNGGTAQIKGASTDVCNLGSLAGEGVVLLSTRPLAVGANNLSTAFSGVIQQQGKGGQSAIFQKIGKGTLSLSGASTYSGSTAINAGTLVVTNQSGSATGTGAVGVNAGTLGGTGVIAGAVTLGTGSGSGAFLAPAGGTSKPATLTIQKAVTFNADATCTCTLQATKKKSANDEVVANGVTIASGAQFSLVAKVQGKLKAGTSFTIISNTASPPISGTFANLPDGAILTVGNTKLQASYEGGDGNDLALTVVQ